MAWSVRGCMEEEDGGGELVNDCRRVLFLQRRGNPGPSLADPANEL